MTVERLLRQLWRRALRLVRGDTRSRQLHDEVVFWRKWFSTRGSEWPDDYKERLDPNFPLQEHIAKYVDQLPDNPVHILDVGAGPLTKLGKVCGSKQLVITPIDVLAPQYDELLNDFRIQPLVRTITGDAENLIPQFGHKRFDIVHGQNSMDHTANPLRAIHQMLSVTKPDGFVVLFHAENEGKNEGYNQLHKWDFTCENGHFLVKGPGPNGSTVNVTDLLGSVGAVDCSVAYGGIMVAIRKRRL
jgi:SAM-dependent methyltransferase